MKVIKKDGRLQEFDINKIKTTIARVSDDLNQPLTVSDIANIASSVKKEILLSNKSSVTYINIQEAVIKKLQENGFQHIADGYRKGKNFLKYK